MSELIKAYKQVREECLKLKLNYKDLQSLYENGRVIVEPLDLKEQDEILKRCEKLGVSATPWISEGGHGWPDALRITISIID